LLIFLKQLKTAVDSGIGTTNAILPEHQRNDVKALFADCQIELKSLESDISKAQLDLATLQDRHAEHLSRMQKLQTALAS